MKAYQKLLAILVVGLCLAIIAGTAIRSPGQSHAASAPANWVQAGFDRQRNGYNPFETTINATNASQLTVSWSFYYGCGSPIESNGLLYFSDPYSGTLYALNASTGARVWADAGRGSSYVVAPALANGILYSGTASGTLYAVNAATGKLRWGSTAGAGFDASPLWANGMIFIGSQNGRLYTFNATTGKIVWSFLTGSPYPSDAATDNGTVYIDSGGTLYALSAKTGKLLWKYAAQGSPVIANGLVYIGTSEVVALNEKTGKFVWADTAGSNGAVAAANGDVFFSSGGSLLADNALTGQTLWGSNTASESLSINSTPVVANGVVYVGGEIQNEQAAEMAFNEKTGALLWYDYDYDTNAPGASPIVVNGMLFFGTVDDDTIWAYHL